MVEKTKTPWHLWVLGLLSLAWNAFGAFDFIQTTTRGEAYMRESGFDDAMIAYYNAMPNWMYAPWIMGVWGAVLGSVLLLARSRWAVHAFAISWIGAAVSLIYSRMIDPPPLPADLPQMAVMPFVIVAVATLLLWYAWAMAKKGVLR